MYDGHLISTAMYGMGLLSDLLRFLFLVSSSTAFLYFVLVLYLLPAHAGRFFGFWLDFNTLLDWRDCSLWSPKKGDEFTLRQ